MDLIKNFLAIDVLISPIDEVIYWLDLTPRLLLAIPVRGGYKIIKEDLDPEYAISAIMELRKQGLDVLFFPTKTTLLRKKRK